MPIIEAAPILTPVQAEVVFNFLCQLRRMGEGSALMRLGRIRVSIRRGICVEALGAEAGLVPERTERHRTWADFASAYRFNPFELQTP